MRAKSSSSWTATGEFPTIAGTGTEDYFNGSYDFVSPLSHAYQEFSGALYRAGASAAAGRPRADTRFGLYRWHITDPVRFKSDLKVTIQGLGWQQDGEGRVYRPIHENISSVAFWYQQGAHAPYPALPGDADLQPQRR